MYQKIKIYHEKVNQFFITIKLIGSKIEKEEVSLTDKFTYIHSYLKDHRRFSFRNLLEKQHSKMHIVVTFLAILEMMKLGEIRVEQDCTCGEILIERT